MDIFVLLIAVLNIMEITSSATVSTYAYRFWNAKYSGTVMDIVPSRSVLDCTTECLFMHLCNAINYAPGLCEITFSPFSPGVNVTEELGWIHVLLEMDGCLSSPCQNGGTCWSDGGQEFSCTCSQGYEGIHCQDQSGPCTTGINPVTRTCYWVDYGSYTFDEAHTACVNQGGYLVSITTQEEQQFIKDEGGIFDAAQLWIGLARVTTSEPWYWRHDDTEATFLNWDGAEPTDLSVELCGRVWQGVDGMWGDNRCTPNQLSALCEKPYV